MPRPLEGGIELITGEAPYKLRRNASL